MTVLVPPHAAAASLQRRRVAPRSPPLRACASQANVSSSHASASSAEQERLVLREVVTLGLPILGAALSEPLLTLVDSVCCGRTCGTLALAALSVNCSLFNLLSNSFSFLVTTCTNTVAAALSAGEEGTLRSRRLVANSLLLALALSLPITLLLYACPDLVLSLYGAAAGTELAASAKDYLLLRAASVPSILLMFAAVGASLGAGNSLAPSLAIAAAALANVAGDVSLVLFAGMGVAGAAAATCAASWLGTGVLLSQLRGSIRPAFRLPTMADLAPLFAVGSALLLAQLSSSLVYSYTTNRAAMAGVAIAAAHQVQLQTWWLISYVPVPLYLAASSLLGRDLGAHADIGRAEITIRVLFRLACFLAVALAALNAALPLHASASISSDPAVAAAVRASLPAAVFSQALATLNTTLEGIFAGSGRLRHVASVSLLSSLIGATCMTLTPASTGLLGPWMGLALFEAVRTICHAAAWRGFAKDVSEGRARSAGTQTA